MPLTHFVLDAAGDSVGEFSGIFLLHFLGEDDKFVHGNSHGCNFFMATATTLTVGAFVGAFTVAWNKFHCVISFCSFD